MLKKQVRGRMACLLAIPALCSPLGSSYPSPALLPWSLLFPKNSFPGTDFKKTTTTTTNLFRNLQGKCSLPKRRSYRHASAGSGEGSEQRLQLGAIQTQARYCENQRNRGKGGGGTQGDGSSHGTSSSLCYRAQSPQLQQTLEPRQRCLPFEIPVVVFL